MPEVIWQAGRPMAWSMTEARVSLRAWPDTRNEACQAGVDISGKGLHGPLVAFLVNAIPGRLRGHGLQPPSATTQNCFSRALQNSTTSCRLW